MTILNGLTSKNKITQYKNVVYKLVLQMQVEDLRDKIFFFFLKKDLRQNSSCNFKS